jgi:hypothetical protein
LQIAKQPTEKHDFKTEALYGASEFSEMIKPFDVNMSDSDNGVKFHVTWHF